MLTSYIHSFFFFSFFFGPAFHSSWPFGFIQHLFSWLMLQYIAFMSSYAPFLLTGFCWKWLVGLLIISHRIQPQLATLVIKKKKLHIWWAVSFCLINICMFHRRNNYPFIYITIGKMIQKDLRILLIKLFLNNYWSFKSSLLKYKLPCTSCEVYFLIPSLLTKRLLWLQKILHVYHYVTMLYPCSN